MVIETEMIIKSSCFPEIKAGYENGQNNFKMDRNWGHRTNQTNLASKIITQRIVSKSTIFPKIDLETSLIAESLIKYNRKYLFERL